MAKESPKMHKIDTSQYIIRVEIGPILWISGHRLDTLTDIKTSIDT